MDPFLRSAARFLAAERAAEVAAAQARLAGPPPPSVLGKLRLVETHAGPGGATALVLAPPDEAGEAPPIGRELVSVGDVVQVASRKAAASAKFKVTGVVTKLARGGMTVLVGGVDVEEAADGEEGMDALGSVTGMLRVDKLANDVTYKRMKWALNKLESQFAHSGAHPVVDVLFHNAPVSAVSPARNAFALDDQSLAKLNESQKRAAHVALNADRLAVVWGPPGTGKTTLLVEVILACVRSRKDKVLACAPSNIAVDTLAERLAVRTPRLRIVRVGHPARLLPSVVDLSLDARVSAEFSGVGLDIRKEMDGIHRQLRSARTPRQERYKLRGLLRSLQKELRVRENDTMKRILIQADVILATCAGAGDRALNCLDPFGTVIVDEAAQALEPTSWIPAGLGNRLILVGDNKQLPPTVVSTKDPMPTMFDRARKITKDVTTVMLDTQYRMNAKIANWASKEMYKGDLLSHISVENHVLCDLPDVESTSETTEPLVYIDTAGADLEESLEDSPNVQDVSYCNEGEAGIVLKHMERLMDAGVKASQIAVISPYAGQVRLLRRKLTGQRETEVDTVDGFQGREQEVVIISLVRSNEDSQVGFLSDHRRLNVAVTRAKRHVCVIGDSCTITADAFIQRFIDWADEHGQYRSAFDYNT